MTIPLILLAIPSVLLGLYLGLPLGREPDHRAGWRRSSRRARRILRGGAAEPAYQLFGIDGVLIIASVTIATIGLVIAWRLFGVQHRSDPPAGPPRTRPRADRPGAVPVPRVAQQVVVRRPVPPAVHRHRRQDRHGRVVVRPRSRSTGRSTRSAPVTIDAGRGLRQIQTGRVQNYALGIAIGLIVMAGSYLAPGAGADDERHLHPAPVDHHLPAAHRRARCRHPARILGARPWRSGSRARHVRLLALPAASATCPAGPASSSSRPAPGSRLRHPVQGRRRRAVDRARRPDDDADVDRDPVLVQADPDPDQGIHDLVPRPRGRDDRRLPRPRHVPVLHLLGDRARPDVPDHRDLGRREPDLRDDQVRALHAGRVAADAGRDPGHGVRLPARPWRLVDRRVRLRAAPRVRRRPAGSRAASSSRRSWPSSSPSRSRSRCSRSTPGCRMRIPRRRRRGRSSWPRSCSSSVRTASSGSPCRSTRTRPRRSRPRSSCCRSSRSSTARSWPWSNPTSSGWWPIRRSATWAS